MEGSSTDCGGFEETVVFLEHFQGLPDPRQRGKVMYPLDEVLLLCLLAVVAGAETITDIARFGDKKLALLRRFRPFASGTPAHDHLGDILASLDAPDCRQPVLGHRSHEAGLRRDGAGRRIGRGAQG